MRRDRVLAALVVALVVLLGVWAVPRLEVATDVTHFMPAGADAELADLSRALTSSDLNRTVTLTLHAQDADTAAAVTRALSARLAERAEVDWVRGGPDSELQRAFYEAYFPHRLGLHRGVSFEPSALRDKARALRNQLSAPTGAFVRELATDDPWLLFVDHLDRLQVGQQGPMHVRQGAFVTGEDERYGVVLLASASSPFDGAATRRLQDAIAEDAAAVREEVADFELEQGGIHPIAQRSEAVIRADIERVSLAGTLGVVLIILLLFRSPFLLALAGLPLAGGMVVALAASVAIFGSVHGLTLAFGATLIGVALDYVAHLMNHHALEGRESGWLSLRAILPGLVLGAATTVVGLAGLAWTSFPGIRQMAVFTSVGVSTALLLTCVLLPPFLPIPARATALHTRIAGWVSRALVGLAERRKSLVALVALSLAIAAVGIPLLQWEDDIRALSPLDPEQMAEDERVRGRVARLDSGRLIVSSGDNLQEALNRNDQVAELLAAAVDASELDGFRSLRDLLPSERTQRQAFESIPDDAFARTVAALEAEGFVAAPFEGFEQVLQAPFDPLTEDHLGASLSQLTGAHVLRQEGRVHVLSFVRGVRDVDALIARVEAVEGVRFFDQTAFMADAYGSLRGRTLELVVLGLLAVLALVFIRYRAIRPTLAAFLPATIAAGCTLGLFGLMGETANLLHVVTLLLVLSMGVDYGVFMVEAARHEGEGDSLVGSTTVSLLVACASTFASFGVLAMSANPAMRSMGLTAAIGVLLSLVLAPTAWVLFIKAGVQKSSTAER